MQLLQPLHAAQGLAGPLALALMLRDGIACIDIPEPLVHPDGAIATALLLKHGQPVRQGRVLLAEDREQLGALEGLLNSD